MSNGDPTHPPRAIQRAFVLGLLIALRVLLAPDPCGAQSLIFNGAFSEGEGAQPRAWKSDQWNPQAGSVFEWKPSATGPGVVVIRNAEPNDSRWTQSVRVEPNTWYRLSGWMRAVGVDRGFGGSLSPVDGFDRGRELRGPDTGWQPLAMWFKTKADQRVITVACRLGNFGSTAVGEVACTGVELTAQGRPPLNADYVYGPIEESTTPVGLPASFALIALVVAGLWRYGRLPAVVAWRERLTFDGLLLALLAAKIVVAPLFQYKIDVNAYAAWAMKLAQEGPARFYAPGYFADYPPGYMYVLWWIGLASKLLSIAWGTKGFIILLKLPALLADLAVSRLIFARLRPAGSRVAWLAALAFALNPALILDSTVWGQTDSVLAMLTLLAFLAQGERRFELAWAFAALAVLAKPQALLLVPLLVFWPWNWWKTGRPLSAALAALATVYVIADPFRGERPWSWLVELYGGTAGYYSETSVNAMNLMALAFGMRRSDAEVVLGLTPQIWGFLLGGAFGLAFLVPLLRHRTRVLHASLFASASLVSFLCLTRMHERYLYPFFAFAGLLGVTGSVGALYWGLSALFLVNELAVYLYQESATAGPPLLWGSVAALNGVCLLAWLGLTWKIGDGAVVVPGAAALDADDRAWETSQSASEHVLHPAVHTTAASPPAAEPAWNWQELALLAVITLGSAILRFWKLGLPTDLVFDEVYFVEQGRNYLKGQDFMDPHPPIAKLAIALGIELFGDAPIGWRAVNAVVGTALVPLFYLLARSLFLRRPAAVFAALLIAIDGLAIVDSRIAVIDIHYVTWAVAAYVVLIKLIRAQRFESLPGLLLLGVLIGLSVGAKLYIPFFSFLLVLGSLGACAWSFAKRSGRAPLGFTLRPVVIVGATASVIYALAFAPHFLWGWWTSPLDLVKYIVFKVPEYQAAVKTATHPYSSKWWTWPLLLRPVWYFWKDPSDVPGMVVGIWGAGNPSVWWASVPALLFATWVGWRERRAALGFVLAGWLIHLAPWVPIGRTLFLYHYLPSLLFALLALAWLLDRLWSGEGSRLERGLIGAAILGSLFPVATFTAPGWGPVLFLGALIAYEGGVFSQRAEPARLGQAAVLVFCAAAIAVSWYLAPIWLGIPLTKADWQARMWISGSQLMNWI